MSLLNRRIVALAVLGAVAYGLIGRLAFSEKLPIAVPMTFTFIFLIPMAVGYLAATGDRGEWRAREAVLLPFGAALMVLITVLAIGVEGLICVVMMLPVFLVMALVGGTLAWAVRKVRDRRLRASALLAVLMLPYAAGPVEQRIPQMQSRRVVENRIRIRADPAAVWRQIIRVPAIRPEEYRTTFIHRIGFPRPIEATLSHEGVGGVREASFERGVLFRETVTQWVPRRRLSFTIAVDSIPTKTLDQHVTVGGEYFDVLDGTYEIVPIGPGETELRLWSTHRLSTHFNAYAALWTDFVMRQIQGNILEVVRARAEAAQ
ncbi:MAG TPA: hypothetical protein VGX50_03495 [Longimicrobium sp.]|jgi:hypothetical protein|nr:hypothetical protein [Longimicrobium sp.]